MSEPDGRYDAPRGSSAFTGAGLPGQPLADQPTEVVPPVDWHRDHRGDDDHRNDRDGEPAHDPYDATSTRPDYRNTPVVVRRADTVAGLLLLLSGIAAGVSLLVVWVHGGGTGLDLVRNGVHDLADPQRLVDRNSWEPLAVVFGGAALFVIGLLMYVPGKTHRFLGVLALLVSLAVAAGVLVPLADLDWDVQRWAVGCWIAVAVGGLGFLGALKALMTHPRRR
jgi:hypothetical protein